MVRRKSGASLPQKVSADRQEREALASWWLRDVRLRLEPGQLVAVVGRVGSGKSSAPSAPPARIPRIHARAVHAAAACTWTLAHTCSFGTISAVMLVGRPAGLISALLGEMERSVGRVAIGGRMAYVAQQAWILNETLQENILFGQDFDEARWRAVVDVRPILPPSPSPPPPSTPDLQRSLFQMRHQKPANIARLLPWKHWRAAVGLRPPQRCRCAVSGGVAGAAVVQPFGGHRRAPWGRGHGDRGKGHQPLGWTEAKNLNGQSGLQ